MINALKTKNIKHFSTLSNTLSFAQEWVNESTPDEGSVVLADFQTHGKGTGKNSWESEQGKNILLSMILYPGFLLAKNQFQLNKVFSLAIFDTIATIVSEHGLAIKWPNDVMVNRRKIAGILFQNTIEQDVISTSIAGLGLNVNQVDFPDNIPVPCSLKSITGRNLDKGFVLNDLLENIEKYYHKLKQGKDDEIGERYLERLLNFGTESAFRSGSDYFIGKISGVSPFGQLEILVGKQLRLFDMKEIEFIL